MAETKYKLRYLPLFYDELEQKIVYIAEKPHNEKAANDLIKLKQENLFTDNPICAKIIKLKILMTKIMKK